MDPIRPNTPPINGDIPPPAVPSDEIIQSILNELASQALTLIRECPEFQPMLVAVAHSRGQDPEQIFAEDSPTLALVHQLFMETFAPILEDCIRNESTADPSGGADLIDKIQGEFNLFQEKLIGELRPQVTGASFSEQEISTIKRLAHLDLQIYQSALPAIGHPDAEIMGMMTNDMMEANHFALIVPGEKASSALAALARALDTCGEATYVQLGIDLTKAKGLKTYSTDSYRLAGEFLATGPGAAAPSEKGLTLEWTEASEIWRNYNTTLYTLPLPSEEAREDLRTYLAFELMSSAANMKRLGQDAF